MNHTLNWQLYRSLQGIPYQVIDHLIESSHGSVFQSPQWYRATHPNPRNCIVVSAYQEGLPVFSALVEKSRLPGTKYHYGYIHRGPVFDEIDKTILLWSIFEKIILDEGICAITIQPFWEQNIAKPLIDHLNSIGYAISLKSKSHWDTLFIDLRRSTEDIFREDFSSMRRGRIRKAIKLGMKVEPVRSNVEMSAFWDMYQTMCIRKQIPFWSLDMFGKVFRYSQENPNRCTCLIGWLKNEMVGGIIALKHGITAEFTKGASTSKQLTGVPKTELLHWKAIQWAKDSGAQIYDLGGYTPNAEAGSQEWGVNRFKSGFSQNRMQIFKPMEKVFHAIPYKIFHSLRTIKKQVAMIGPQMQKVLQ